LIRPEFASVKVASLSSFMAEDPVKVVREAIKGIRKNKLHVCPASLPRSSGIGPKHGRLFPDSRTEGEK
jgi:hypothetical protein